MTTFLNKILFAPYLLLLPENVCCFRICQKMAKKEKENVSAIFLLRLQQRKLQYWPCFVIRYVKVSKWRQSDT